MDKQIRTLSILGDSYSTFKGWLPEGNYIYYPNVNVPDMTRAEDTWWQILITKRGFRMLINDISDAFVMRMKNSLSENGVNGEKPDCILLFGGTNDGWTNVKVGKNQYADWTDEDLKEFLPAFCYMLDYVTGQNPQARIAAIVNTDLADGMPEGMQQACEHYGVQCILLHDISKVCGHPDRQGMRQIAEQVDAALG